MKSALSQVFGCFLSHGFVISGMFVAFMAVVTFSWQQFGNLRLSVGPFDS